MHSQLNHKHIIPFIETDQSAVDTQTGEPCAVMVTKFAENESLFEIVKSCGGLGAKLTR